MVPGFLTRWLGPSRLLVSAVQPLLRGGNAAAQGSLALLGSVLGVRAGDRVAQRTPSLVALADLAATNQTSHDRLLPALPVRDAGLIAAGSAPAAGNMTQRN